jgi:AcrR family transcriptional regulator
MPKIIEDVDVFQAVMQVVSERGYSGATTREMAEAANMSEVTLFRKYGSKLELVQQAISHIVKQSGFDEAISYTGDLEADLRRVIEAYRVSALRHGLFFSALLADFTRHPELSESMNAPLVIFQSVGKLISRYQADGKLRDERPEHAVAALLGPMIYGSMISSATEEASYPPLRVDEHLEAYLGGRRNRGS